MTTTKRKLRVSQDLDFQKPGKLNKKNNTWGYLVLSAYDIVN